MIKVTQAGPANAAAEVPSVLRWVISFSNFFEYIVENMQLAETDVDFVHVGVSMVQNAMVETTSNPYTLLLGVAQDGGYPQASCRAAVVRQHGHPDRRGVSSLGIANPLS